MSTYFKESNSPNLKENLWEKIFSKTAWEHRDVKEKEISGNEKEWEHELEQRIVAHTLLGSKENHANKNDYSESAHTYVISHSDSALVVATVAGSILDCLASEEVLWSLRCC